MIWRHLDEKIIEQTCLTIGKGGLGNYINADEYGNQQYTDSKILTYHLSKYILENEPLRIENMIGPSLRPN